MGLKILIVGGIIIFTALVIFIILFIFLYQKRYYRHLREKEQLKTKFSQELLQSQLEIQEQTLKNITQEIHDNIGQELTLAKLNLNTIDLSKPVELPDKINTSKNLVSKAIQDLRDLSRSMNMDSIMSMGLTNSIENELDMIRKTEMFNTSFDVQGEIPRLDEKKELILFRIVQESLHNIIKHASAKNINVTIKYANDILALDIKDDGKGFETAIIEGLKPAGVGMGLRNMHNRADLINAGFFVNSIKDSGTHIRLELPLNPKS